MFFTIAVPAFKGLFLEQCIKSILTQTFRDFEVVILNDSSPDNIKSIVEKFNDKRIKYYENSVNVGVSNVVDNWNKCLYLTNGKYLSLIGDDDILENNYLEVFYNNIKNNEKKSIFHCRSWIINEMDEKIDLTHALPQTEDIFEYVWHRLSDKRIQFVGDFVYKVSDLRKNGGFIKLPLAWFSDDLTSFKATLKNGIIHINTPLFRYRRNSLSITSTGKITDKLEAKEKYFQYLEEHILSQKPSNFKESIYLDKIKNSLSKISKKKEIEIVESATLNLFKTLSYIFSLRKEFQPKKSVLIFAFIKNCLRKYYERG